MAQHRLLCIALVLLPACGGRGPDRDELLRDLQHGASVEKLDALDALGRDPTGYAYALDALQDLLGPDEDSHVRTRAAKLLGQLGSRASIAAPDLAHGVYDEDEQVVFWFVTAAGEVGSGLADSATTLVNGGRLVTSCRNLTAIVRALGEIGSASDEVVEYLASTLSDIRCPELPRRAAHALMVIGPSASRALPALEALLRDGRPKDREAAALAVASVGAASVESAAAALGTATGDRDEAVASAAVVALVRMGAEATRLARPQLEAAARGGLERAELALEEIARRGWD